MLHAVVAVALGAILVVAAGLKLAAPRASAEALATFGVPRTARLALLLVAVVVEAGLGVAVAAGADVAAFAAAALLVAFAVAQAAALRRGQAGRPCACFGARSTLSPRAVARDAALAAAFSALPFLPREDPSTDTWLAIGLGVALVAVACLAVAVLALAREVGMLRLALGPQRALDLEGEGPPVGTRLALAARFASTSRTTVALAVFSSEGCPVCEATAPAIEAVRADPEVSVEVFDEHRHADAWAEAAVPGAPYAVALHPRSGQVLAKGTFNGLGQLDGLLGTALARADEAGAPEVAHA